MDRGEYVPDDITIKVVCARLDQPDARDGFILDGFPRTERQAEALDEALAARGRRVDVALLITAPVELLVNRIGGRLQCPHCGAVYNTVTHPPKQQMVCDVCGHSLIRRTDEDLQVVRARIDAYNHQTQAVIDHYRGQGKLRDVDGSLTIEEVNREVNAVVRLGAATGLGG
jgi:adenylate kinase